MNWIQSRPSVKMFLAKLSGVSSLNYSHSWMVCRAVIMWLLSVLQIDRMPSIKPFEDRVDLTVNWKSGYPIRMGAEKL